MSSIRSRRRRPHHFVRFVKVASSSRRLVGNPLVSGTVPPRTPTQAAAPRTPQGFDTNAMTHVQISSNNPLSTNGRGECTGSSTKCACGVWGARSGWEAKRGSHRGTCMGGDKTSTSSHPSSRRVMATAKSGAGANATTALKPALRILAEH